MTNSRDKLKKYQARLKFILLTTKDEDLLKYCEKEMRRVKDELALTYMKKK